MIEFVNMKQFRPDENKRPNLFMGITGAIQKQIVTPVIIRYEFALCPHRDCETLLNQVCGLKRCPVCGQRISFPEQEATQCNPS